MNPKKVSFGFETVNAEEKPEKVREVFSSDARKYDIMNDLMSLGVHRLWKKRLLEELKPNRHLLDIAGGTGDIARLYIKKGGAHATLCDLTLEMLQEGQKNILDHFGHADKFTFIHGDGENLPFADNHFDYITIAFGLRNMTFLDKALRSAYRSLKPGGKIFILEFSPVDAHEFGKIYDWWSFKVLPKLGKIVASDSDSYLYLAESIRRFPKAETLREMMEKAGFEGCSYQHLTMGIVAIHQGWKVNIS